MLIAPPRPAATLGPAAQLFVADHRQHRSQVLVVGDGALVDLANLVKGAVGEVDPVVADHKPSIRVVENGDVFADCCLGQLARLQNEDYLVVLQCQRLREAALFFPGKRVLKILSGMQVLKGEPNWPAASVG